MAALLLEKSVRRAFLKIRPDNIAAQLAFHRHVRTIIETPVEAMADSQYAAICRHIYLCSYNQDFMIEKDVRDSKQEGAPIGYPAFKGGFQISLVSKTPSSWILGKPSSSNCADIVLTRLTKGIRTHHATLLIDPHTRRMYLNVAKSSQMKVSGHRPRSDPQGGFRAALNEGKNRVTFGPLEYIFEYTDYARTEAGEQDLNNVLSGMQVRRFTLQEALASPTPSQKPIERIGDYVVGSTLGEGGFGTVKSAVCSSGHKIYAVKEVKGLTLSQSAKKELEHFNDLVAKSDKTCHVLSICEYLEFPDKTCFVLEPFASETLDIITMATQ